MKPKMPAIVVALGKGEGGEEPEEGHEEKASAEVSDAEIEAFASVRKAFEAKDDRAGALAFRALCEAREMAGESYDDEEG